MLPIASWSGSNCSVTSLPVATISLLAISALAISELAISVLALSVLSFSVLAFSEVAISGLALSVLAISVATVSVAGRAAACVGRQDPNRAMTPRPKVRAKDLPRDSPGAVGSSGEPVVNRLRGTTGSPGVAERG
jgi:hypothetical protein